MLSNAAVLGAWQPECFEADEGHGFGLDFAEAPRSQFRIAQTGLGLGRVTEHDVSEFMKPRLVREFGDG